ncbi:MAG: hypothetical protein IKI06_09550, partial [Prevotella sp.]|nr:hypothetical protein [Prevotella sp.]
MKLLLKHITSLLRTALLLGVLAFVTTPQTMAQTAEQLAEMPSAFETIEDPNSVIGNGQYYYIQFYYNGRTSYLTDCGFNKRAWTKDFLPSNNRLWTLERVGDGQFKLKNKDGNYLGYGRFESADRYGGVAEGDAIVFTFGQFKGGYYIKRANSDHVLYRNNNGEWADFPYGDGRDSQKYYGFMHIVKLKSSNVAYIIYYRGEEETDGAGNTDANAASSRHYLTYSGLNAISDNWNTHDGWTALGNTLSVITNGDLDTSNDYSSFYQRINGVNQQAPIGGGVSGNGIAITSAAGQANAWDTQFFIKANEPLPEGTRFRVQFNCAATNTVEIGTQAHGEPGTYHHWDAIGNVTFGGGSVVERFGTVTADMAGADGMQSIAFNLGMTGNQPQTTFYIDNIIFEVLRTSDVSNRTSILYTNDAWKIPTAAAYHQDGLWELEESGTDGQFYIKKYGSTNEYLNCWPIQSGVSGYNILGEKDELHGKYALETPTANRYTRVLNANNYTSTALTSNLFYRWNYDTSDPANSTPNGLAGAEQHYGQELGQLGLAIGYGNVSYQVFADLTGYAMMVIEGTPGMQLRVSLNRLAGDGDGGDITLLTPVIGDDGKAVIDLIALPYPYIHLNAIKNGYGINGTITGVTLLRSNSSNNNFLSHSDSGDHEGKMIMQYGDGNNNIQIGFRPVEVPVPNKDKFYQVLLQLKSNTNQMVDHNGVAITYDNSQSGRKLFQLEQVDDYSQFRLKNPSGQYLKPYPSDPAVTEPNDPTEADIIDNLTLIKEKFNLEWFFVDPNAVPKEHRVEHWVTHRQSYLKQYSIAHSDLDLAAQGLATEAQSDWWNFGEGVDDPKKDTQKVNHFEITHYVKQGNSVAVEFPTVLNKNNDHIYFQRFYNYDEKDYAMDQTNANAQSMDLDNLKAHVSLDTRNDGDVQYFLYNNGMVTGEKLNWTGIEKGSYARNELRRFNFTNSDGERFTVAVDVSRYSDMTYKNTTAHLDGDLEEPSLTMRYVYYMRDAKEMAASLTACPENGTKWLETKEFHFPAKRIAYELDKAVGYRGEFIGLRHVFSDYWVFDGQGTDNANLVSAVNDNNGGKIEVEIADPNGTGIRLGGWNPSLARTKANNQNPNGHLKFVDNIDTYSDEIEEDFRGFYFYDKMSDGNKTEYGNSRFVVFRYPEGGVAKKTGKANAAYLNVYLNNNGTRYKLAQYTIIFDPGTRTIPWKLRDDTPNPTDDTPLFVKGSDRDPQKLVEKAGKPIAKITFDYPANDKYHFPDDVQTRQSRWYEPTGGTLDDCSPIPLRFDNTNYSFMGFECNWGSYSIVNKMTTNYGNHQNAAPANDVTYGYGPTAAELTANPSLKSLLPDNNLQNGFLYIDASEQPGDICSAPFVGDFCSGDKLMFSGWISGSNKMGGGDNRCPGGITLTVKGEDKNGNKITLYRFCPGQCYELDDGPQNPDGSGNDGEEYYRYYGDDYIDSNGITVKNGDYVDALPKGNKVNYYTEGNTVVDERVKNPNYDNYKYNVIWQQFYFEFTVSEKYERHWIEVNNNCVSSQGGDFMLDNIEVYANVPEVEPEINTPLCVKKDGTTEMRLLKLKVNYNKVKSSSGVNDGATEDPYLGFVFLDKKVFLETFKTQLGFGGSIEELAEKIEDGDYNSILGSDARYQAAFNAALLREPGNTTIWASIDEDLTDEEDPTKNMGAGVMYFQWKVSYDAMEEYSFYKAINKKGAVFRYTDENGQKFIIMNGNYPQLPWKTNTDYYIIPSNNKITNFDNVYGEFNLCSQCSRTNTFRIEPPYHVLGLESSETTNDYVVCEGQIPTILLDLKGYTLDGKEVDMNDLNFDWWLGNKTTLATLENYHNQDNGLTGDDLIKLDEALSTLRTYYPAVTSLDGITKEVQHSPDPKLTVAMVEYLQSLVEKGELILHQKSVSIPAEKASNEDPYFYLVACPIHDEKFNQSLNPKKNEYVAYFCDEPQGLRIKVGQKAPTLKAGFVPNEHGFDSYDYSFPEGSDPVLSIRLAKAAQFETVKNTEEEADDGTLNYEVNHLWLPIRNARTEGADGVIKKSKDDNIYLASSNDPTWDKKIYKSMSKTGLLPIVGRIVTLEAINTKGTSGDINISAQNDENRLRVYFTENFEVREGYNYTLSLPFQEEGDVNTCDGTMLINLKIVPDYEVWTGAAGNPDWNNDENWRRADGNTEDNTGLNGDELYVASAAAPDPAHDFDGSPLYGYKTNYWNYRTAKDRVFRKGFAPLYCTHILMKADEWGNAPELYDPLDYKDTDAEHKFTNFPFPNLRETSTPILKFDMQARRYDLWEETYGTPPDRGESSRTNDLIAEMYKVNSCDEIAFQPGTELMNAHLLNYNSAWMEYQLDNKRWYLLGSPLQGTISGEWYAPTGTAKQETTYYDPVKFNDVKPGATEGSTEARYDRYSPAIYQRSWDKAKTVLYEVGSTYSTGDDNQTGSLGTVSQGQWSEQEQTINWDATGADAYLDRLGYKPMGGNKANVAIKGIWSNTYNDAQVDYANGGFSVMVMNHLKNKDNSNGKSIIRLPKEDTMYDYYEFSEDGKNDGGTDTQLSDVRFKNRAKNRGRLKTDNLLPATIRVEGNDIEIQKTETEASIYGDARN